MPGTQRILSIFVVFGSLAVFPQRPASPDLRVDSDLVLIPASVVDRDDHLILDLPRNRFRVFEDKQEQAVTHFAVEEVPVSAAILFDVSRSMKGWLPHAREAVEAILASSRPSDEFCLVTFRDHPELAVKFGAGTAGISNALATANARGGTALADGIVLALDYLKKAARQRRRALLIFSDGGERDSRYSWGEVRSLVREADVRLYPFLLPNPAEDEKFDRLELRSIAEESGGRSFPLSGGAQLREAAGKLDIHWQYVLGYRPVNHDSDGRYRRVEVKLAEQPRDRKLKLFWRRGYVASQ